MKRETPLLVFNWPFKDKHVVVSNFIQKMLSRADKELSIGIKWIKSV